MGVLGVSQPVCLSVCVSVRWSVKCIMCCSLGSSDRKRVRKVMNGLTGTKVTALYTPLNIY